SLTYIMLKSLGFPRVKGYPGSWSDWGNRQDTPVD
ncbi:MAG: sulfurtransferase, partial [Sedimenticola sp.]|nr:sulfurtransferase [Sedimenticola sp.]